MLQKIILGILIVPALCFLAVLAVLPFLAWKDLTVSDRFIGLGFSTVAFLIGLFLWRLLVRKEAPKSQQESSGRIGPFLSLTTLEITAFVIWIIVSVAAKWNAALGNDTRLLRGVIITGEVFIFVMIGRRITKHLINRKKNARG